jgi:hypothetical protein
MRFDIALVGWERLVVEAVDAASAARFLRLAGFGVADAAAYQARGHVYGRAHGGSVTPAAEGAAILQALELAPGIVVLAEVQGEDEALILVCPPTLGQ